MANEQFTNPFEFDFSKYFADLKVPGMDVDGLLTSQRKNIEALTKANRLALEGAQAVVKRQMELLRTAVEEATSVATTMAKADSPQERMIAQTEITKEVFERALSSMREMSELLAKSNAEVFDLLNARFTQSLDEIKDMIGKAAATSGAAAPSGPSRSKKSSPST